MTKQEKLESLVYAALTSSYALGAVERTQGWGGDPKLTKLRNRRVRALFKALGIPYTEGAQ